MLNIQLLFYLKVRGAAHKHPDYLTEGTVSSFIVDSETSQPRAAASPERSSGPGAPFPDFVSDINRMNKLRQAVRSEGLEIRGPRVPTQKIDVSL